MEGFDDFAGEPDVDVDGLGDVAACGGSLLLDGGECVVLAWGHGDVGVLVGVGGVHEVFFVSVAFDFVLFHESVEDVVDSSAGGVVVGHDFFGCVVGVFFEVVEDLLFSDETWFGWFGWFGLFGKCGVLV